MAEKGVSPCTGVATEPCTAGIGDQRHCSHELVSRFLTGVAATCGIAAAVGSGCDMIGAAAAWALDAALELSNF